MQHHLCHLPLYRRRNAVHPASSMHGSIKPANPYAGSASGLSVLWVADERGDLAGTAVGDFNRQPSAISGPMRYFPTRVIQVRFSADPGCAVPKRTARARKEKLAKNSETLSAPRLCKSLWLPQRPLPAPALAVPSTREQADRATIHPQPPGRGEIDAYPTYENINLAH